MLIAKLVILPTLNKSDFMLSAESVTGKNHLRSTDAKNLGTALAEMLSITEDFAGYSDAGMSVAHIGFLFAGTFDLIDFVICEVDGKFIKTTLSKSPILSSALVIATFREWESAIERVLKRDNESLRTCFQKIAFDLSKFRRRNDLLRI